MEEKNPIQVADRIFLVIEALAETGPAGLTELSTRLELNKTTVHRILNSLIYMGYVRQDPETSHYSLSFKIWDIANQLITRIDVVDIARPYLRELMERTGETVHLVQMDGIYAIYIDKVESQSNTVRLVSRIGKRIPLYCSGVGKAILADLSSDDAADIWNHSSIDALTRHTITTYDHFSAELEQIRQRGYALDNEENEIGVRCIAASVTDPHSREHYAFSISAPISRMDNARIRELSGYILETKAAILKNWQL